MKVEFAVVPPGGGETDYTFNAEHGSSPATWRLRVQARPRRNAFRMGGLHRKVPLVLAPRKSSLDGRSRTSPIRKESEAHKRSCDAYEAKGKAPQRTQASCS